MSGATKNSNKFSFLTDYERLAAYLLIILGVTSRLLPHPPNFAPIAALALFSGRYLNKKWAIVVPISAMLISDIFLGFHNIMLYVYGSFIIIFLLGIYLKRNFSIPSLFATTICGSIIFFIITNFGVWLQGDLYPLTAHGFIQCYIMAIPFYRNTILGDLVYTGAFFGLYELIKYYLAIKFIPKPKHLPIIHNS